MIRQTGGLITLAGVEKDLVLVARKDLLKMHLHEPRLGAALTLEVAYKGRKSPTTRHGSRRDPVAGAPFLNFVMITVFLFVGVLLLFFWKTADRRTCLVFRPCAAPHQ